MSWYQRKILPVIIDRGMRNSVMTKLRPDVIAQATKTVLEVGIGSGCNIPYYGNIERLYALEPSAELLEKALPMVHSAPYPIELMHAPAEDIPLEDNSVDTVLSSWTLCSIPNVKLALKDMRRVLRPNGRLVFIEHGRAPDPAVEKWQDRLAPVLRAIMGCNINRKMDDLIAEAGFQISTLEARYLDGPKTICFHYIGQAQPGKGA